MKQISQALQYWNDKDKETRENGMSGTEIDRSFLVFQTKQIA